MNLQEQIAATSEQFIVELRSSLNGMNVSFIKALLPKPKQAHLCTFKPVKPCGVSLNLLSLLNESDNLVLTKLKVKFPVKKNVKREV